MQKKITPWWDPEYGFFGNFYMKGDDSTEGFLLEEQLDLRERTAREGDGVMYLLGLKKGDRVLDMPCGYGRHSIYLAEHYGIVPTGADINRSHLKAALKNAQYRRLSLKWKIVNMLDIAYKEKYDAVINMFYSFGFFDTDTQNEKVARNFFNSLKPGGKFLMHTDVNVPRIKSGKYQCNEERELSHNKKLVISERYDASTKRINGSWTIVDYYDPRTQQKEYSVRVYSKEEFTSLCLSVGFKKVEVYSNWYKMPYDSNSEEMMVVATK